MNIYVDGGCHNNQVPDKREAYGSIWFNGIIYRRNYGNCTNNEAEYKSMINGLYLVKSRGIKGAVIYTDSRLVHGQLVLGYKVKDPKIKVLYDMAKELMKDIEVKIIRVPREVIVRFLGH